MIQEIESTQQQLLEAIAAQGSFQDNRLLVSRNQVEREDRSGFDADFLPGQDIPSGVSGRKNPKPDHNPGPQNNLCP